MEHNFEITPDDFGAFNEYATKKHPDTAFLVTTLLVAVLFYGFVLTKKDMSFSLIFLAVTSVLIAVWYFVYKKWIRGRWIRKYAAKLARNSKCLGQCSMKIDAKGINSVINDMRAEYPWKNVQLIVQTETHIYIMFDNILGYVIPKRSFETLEASARFFDELNRLRNVVGNRDREQLGSDPIKI